MSKRIDITNQTFGRWTVKKYIGPSPQSRRSIWECLCSCGNTGAVNSQDLRDGHSRSCGCLVIDIVRERSVKLDSGLSKLLRQYKASARHRKFEFNLDIENFKILTSSPCHYCGQFPIKISIKQAVAGSYVFNGIDRKNNLIGYTKENSVTCCEPCNFLKKDMPYEEFIRRVNAIVKKQNGQVNRIFNSKNPYQGKAKKVLAVCSAGLLRSPTVAFTLSNEPYNYNTRAVGLDAGHALIPIDSVLIEWADEIMVMDEYQEKILKEKTKKPVFNLRIGDNFEYRDKGLITIIHMRMKELLDEKE